MENDVVEGEIVGAFGEEAWDAGIVRKELEELKQIVGGAARS